MQVANGRYETVRPVAAGQYFQSYLGRELSRGRKVFLKIEHDPERFQRDGVVDSHLDLWRTLASRTLTGVPAVLDYGREKHGTFLVTEWIEGQSLRELLVQPERTALPADFLETVEDQCRRILDKMHAGGVLHGDISPGNIMVDEAGRLHLIDLAPPNPLPGFSGVILGTPAYMSPNLKAGGKRMPADDIFALERVIEDAAALLGCGSTDMKDSGAEIRWGELTQRVAAKGAALGPVSAIRSESQLERVRANWEAATAAHSVPVPRPDGTAAGRADFGLFAPEEVTPGQNFFVELWIGPEGDYDRLVTEATRDGPMVERGGRRHLDLARDVLLTATLKMPAFEIDEPMETLGWQGDISNIGFIVKAPATLPLGSYPGIVKIAQGQVPFASIAFYMRVVPRHSSDDATTRNRHQEAQVSRYSHAFASYAQQDRGEVLRRIQGMGAVGTEVFLDVVSQRSGTAWQDILLKKIDESDVLFLFWSRHAAQSDWVAVEWRYALGKHGIEFIHPIALEDPRDVPPPPELASRHFNDVYRAFIAAEEARTGRPTP